MLESFLQNFYRAGFSVGECLLVNALALSPVFLIFDVHCSRIGLLKKGERQLLQEDTAVASENDVPDPELYCFSLLPAVISHPGGRAYYPMRSKK